MFPAALTLFAFCTLTDSFRTTRTNSLRNVVKFATTQPLISSDADTKRIGFTAVADLFLDSPEEVITPRKLTPEGSGVPKWLTGTLLRNGPGLFTVQDPSTDGSMKSTKLRKYDHVFDGLAKITRYHFAEDNSLEFSARFIDSTLFRVSACEKQPSWEFQKMTNTVHNLIP
jgi:Retinal pigment epithelial membrane protein